MSLHIDARISLQVCVPHGMCTLHAARLARGDPGLCVTKISKFVDPLKSLICRKNGRYALMR